MHQVYRTQFPGCSRPSPENLETDPGICQSWTSNCAVAQMPLLVAVALVIMADYVRAMVLPNSLLSRNPARLGWLELAFSSLLPSYPLAPKSLSSSQASRRFGEDELLEARVLWPAARAALRPPVRSKTPPGISPLPPALRVDRE